jgi:hypothetical protein
MSASGRGDAGVLLLRADRIGRRGAALAGIALMRDGCHPRCQRPGTGMKLTGLTQKLFYGRTA